MIEWTKYHESAETRQTFQTYESQRATKCVYFET